MGADELIDAYLYELRSALSGNEAARDRIVAETEDHLWESWDRYLAEGLTSEEAARVAIARFGGARDIASAFPQETAGRHFARAYFAMATLFGSALIAIGLAAWIALPVHAVLGADFLFGPDGQWEAPTRFCDARGGDDCQSAWDDFFLVRALGFGAAASLFGGLIAGAHVLGRRYAFGGFGLSRQTLLAGVYLFSFAGMVLLAGGTLKVTVGPESGWNTWLPAGIASLMMAAAYGAVLRYAGGRHGLVRA